LGWSKPIKSIVSLLQKWITNPIIGYASWDNEKVLELAQATTQKVGVLFEYLDKRLKIDVNFWEGENNTNLPTNGC